MIRKNNIGKAYYAVLMPLLKTSSHASSWCHHCNFNDFIIQRHGYGMLAYIIVRAFYLVRVLKKIPSNPFHPW